MFIWGSMAKEIKKGIYGHPTSITYIFNSKYQIGKWHKIFDQFGEHENKIIFEERNWKIYQKIGIAPMLVYLLD